MKDLAAAWKGFGVFSRRFNSAAGLGALLVIFIATATVFSALPLLRYFRGHTIMDYKLWYETGKHVLAGDEIFFFRSGKYDFMYPPPCALFLAGASVLGQGGLIFLLVGINSAAWFYSARLVATLTAGQRGSGNVWLYLVPSLLVIVWIWSSYHLGQPSVVLLGLMLGTFVALRANREVFAGGLIAVAAAIVALAIVPTDFEVAARGKLQPAERREIFAPLDGLVARVSVETGKRCSVSSHVRRLFSNAARAGASVRRTGSGAVAVAVVMSEKGGWRIAHAESAVS